VRGLSEEDEEDVENHKIKTWHEEHMTVVVNNNNNNGECK
jgi:hypothetical protein